MDKFDYGRLEKNNDDWLSTFLTITRLLFLRADLFSFYKGIFNILIGELKKAKQNEKYTSKVIETLIKYEDDLKCIQKYILNIYDHGIPKSLFDKVTRSLKFMHNYLDHHDIPFHRNLFFNYYHDVLSSEGEDRVYDRTELDRILAIQEKNKENIRLMVYDLLEFYNIDNPQPRMCEEGLMTDFDGNQYKTVIIGHQCWTAENLRVRHFNNGEPIQLGTSLDDFSIMYEMSQPGYCHYNFDDQQLYYGLFYNGYAIHDHRGLVPPGWRLPTLTDLEQLKDLLNTYAHALSLGPEVFCAGEPSDDNPGLNLSGFGSLPGGEYSYQHKSPWGYPKWHLGITCSRLEDDYTSTWENAFYWLEDEKELRAMVVSELALKQELKDPFTFCSVRLVRDMKVED